MDPNSSDFGSLTSYLIQLNTAIHSRSGLRLECLLTLTNRSKNPSLFRLVNAGLLDHGNPSQWNKEEKEIRHAIPAPWLEIVLAFWRTAHHLRDPSDAPAAFTHCSAMIQAIMKGFTTFEAWVLPVLFSACRDTRVLAIRADSCVSESDATKKSDHLEEAARLINKAFTICITDRAPMQESRKWGTYCIIGILFRTYFRLNKLSLTKNVLRAVAVSELPDLHYFPKAHIVTWQYYLGVIAFLDEDYARAQRELESALAQCPTGKNRDLVLTYLIPTHLMTSRKLPSKEVLRQNPMLSALYTHLMNALRSGNVAAYDRALAKGEGEFIRRRTYLTLERARDLCLRSLFRKIWMVGDKVTRIPIKKFMIGLNMGVKEGSDAWVDEEEAECFVANMIYKKFMKGYISRERQMVVLSANEPFPRVCR